MELIYSKHWKEQKRVRAEITDELIIHAITHANELRDRDWTDVLNVIARVPTSGRILKVVYKRISKDRIKIITAVWLD